MLEEKVKKYGITKLAYELGVCEISVRNKIKGKTKISPPELEMMKNNLELTDEEVKELKDAQLNNSSSGI